MALSQCVALMGDVPRQRARSSPGPLGRKRLQGGIKQPPLGIHCHTASVIYAIFLMHKSPWKRNKLSTVDVCQIMLYSAYHDSGLELQLFVT